MPSKFIYDFIYGEMENTRAKRVIHTWKVSKQYFDLMGLTLIILMCPRRRRKKNYKICE